MLRITMLMRVTSMFRASHAGYARRVNDGNAVEQRKARRDAGSSCAYQVCQMNWGFSSGRDPGVESIELLKAGGGRLMGIQVQLRICVARAGNDFVPLAPPHCPIFSPSPGLSPLRYTGHTTRKSILQDSLPVRSYKGESPPVY